MLFHFILTFDSNRKFLLLNRIDNICIYLTSLKPILRDNIISYKSYDFYMNLFLQKWHIVVRFLEETFNGFALT